MADEVNFDQRLGEMLDTLIERTMADEFKWRTEMKCGPDTSFMITVPRVGKPDHDPSEKGAEPWSREISITEHVALPRISVPCYFFYTTAYGEPWYAKNMGFNSSTFPSLYHKMQTLFQLATNSAMSPQLDDVLSDLRSGSGVRE